jgi:hypothetical protein
MTSVRNRRQADSTQAVRRVRSHAKSIGARYQYTEDVYVCVYVCVIVRSGRAVHESACTAQHGCLLMLVVRYTVSRTSHCPPSRPTDVCLLTHFCVPLRHVITLLVPVSLLCELSVSCGNVGLVHIAKTTTPSWVSQDIQDLGTSVSCVGCPRA